MQNKAVAKSSTDHKVLTTLRAPAQRKPAAILRGSSVIGVRVKLVSQQERITSASCGNLQVKRRPRLISPSNNFRIDSRELLRLEAAWWLEWRTCTWWSKF